MKKIILITDLWGKSKSDWLPLYLDQLSPHFEVKIYDACAIGDIDISDLSQEKLHQQFVQFGIKKAVSHLLQQEQEVEKIVGFSVGGVIGWQAVQQGLKTKAFIGVSVTRLRYEISKPGVPLHLFYGALDPYQPKEDWFNNIDIQPVIFPGASHDLYKDKRFAQQMIPTIAG